MNRVEGPWCYLGFCGMNRVWRTISADRLFACNNFWIYFDWKRPKHGEQMRLVFSKVAVKGAQKTLIYNEVFGREFSISSEVFIGMYPRLDALLKKLEPRVLSEFNVWWWPEYRDGETK